MRRGAFEAPVLGGLALEHPLEGNDPRRDAAETVGLQGLAFLVSEPRHLERFLSETGFTTDELAA